MLPSFDRATAAAAYATAIARAKKELEEATATTLTRLNALAHDSLRRELADVSSTFPLKLRLPIHIEDVSKHDTPAGTMLTVVEPQTSPSPRHSWERCPSLLKVGELSRAKGPLPYGVGEHAIGSGVHVVPVSEWGTGPCTATTTNLVTNFGTTVHIRWTCADNRSRSDVTRYVVPSHTPHELAPLTQAIIIAATQICTPTGPYAHRHNDHSLHGAGAQLIQRLSDHEFELRLALKQQDETITMLRTECDELKARMVTSAQERNELKAHLATSVQECNELKAHMATFAQKHDELKAHLAWLEASTHPVTTRNDNSPEVPT